MIEQLQLTVHKTSENVHRTRTSVFELSDPKKLKKITSALNAGAKRSGATCYHKAMPQCGYLAKGAKRPSHTTNMLTSSNQVPYILAVTALKDSNLNSAV